MPLIPILATRFEPALTWVSNHRYILLVFGLLLQVLTFTLQGLWVEDFWEHSAAVGEFMRHPLNPSHPQLNLIAPHTFLNPYTFFVALIASLFGLSSITALSIVGVFNFCLFCYGLHAFISNFCQSKDDTSKVSFYALLFILFLWGGQPWPYSGFFSYQIFLFNLPYPSTFIGGLSLLTLGFTGRHHAALQPLQWLVLTIIISLCLLTHPLTAQFLVLGVIAQALGAQNNTTTRVFKIAITCGLAVALASLWPFYPFLALLRGAGTVYDLSNGTMYHHFIERIWPFIALSPLITWAIIQRQNRVLLFIFLSTILVYLFGLYTHKYSYGRIISYTVIIAQICCAIVAIQAEELLDKLHVRALTLYQTVLVCLLVFFSFEAINTASTRLLSAANSVRLGRAVFSEALYKDYNFIPAYVPAGSTVFANLEVSWRLPSFDTKIVAAKHPLAFVPDAEQRRQDVALFFAEGTTSAARLALLTKYRADYVLIDKTLDHDWQQLSRQVSQATHATMQFEDHRFVLLAVKTAN